MNNDLKNIAEIAQRIGALPEYVQGGGGNVSVKLNTTQMAVKASGFRLGDLREDKGLVMVDHQNIRGFYATPHEGLSLPDLESQYSALVKESTYAQTQTPPLRPSIETGFHAILGKHVLHTHAVYANILNCALEGTALIGTLFPDSIVIPYTAPGLPLMLAINTIIKDQKPRSIFLQSHGIITSGDTAEEAHDTHEQIMQTIKTHFALTNPYPSIHVSANTEGGFRSDSPFITKTIKNTPDIISLLRTHVLFPDQVVYTDAISTKAENTTAITIDEETGSVHYATSLAEALAFEETLGAWMYIRETIQNLGLTEKNLSAADEQHIGNMESEHYRKSIL